MCPPNQEWNCPFCLTIAKTAYTLWVHIRGAHPDLIQRWDEITYPEVRAYFTPSEPEIPVGDEIIISEEVPQIKSANIQMYLDKSNPICREERQYAFFLAKDLSSKDSRYITKFKLPGNSVIQIFYEVTLMRDFWNLNKEFFNTELSSFLGTKGITAGLTGTRHANHQETAHPLAKWMMNAKPDLGILSKDAAGKSYLDFIECKYESPMDNYHCKIPSYSKGQKEVQELILEFICKYLKITPGKVYPVQFTLNGKPGLATATEIKIEDLGR